MKRDIVEKEPLKRVIYEEIKENEIENRDFKDLIAKFYLDDINFDDTDDGEHWRFESEADQFFIVLYSNPNYNWPTKRLGTNYLT